MKTAITKTVCTATVFLALAGGIVASFVVHVPLPQWYANAIFLYHQDVPLIAAIAIFVWWLLVAGLACLAVYGLWLAASKICSKLRAWRRP